MRELEIYQKVRQYIIEQKMLTGNECVLIGFSGGADSMALTDLLLRLREEWNLELIAIHVNHGIRGREADRDQEVVQKFCNDRGISCRIYTFDVPEIAKTEHMGCEEAGRLCREKAFASVRKEIKDKKVLTALAHNKNDLAETMIHHLSRGSGLRGLSGISPVKGDKIRPVLCLKREEIEEYCQKRKLIYVSDSTNAEDHYTRNRIRHKVIPALEKEVNQEAVNHLFETAKMVSEAECYISHQAEALFHRQEQYEDKCFFSEEFFMEPRILKSYTIRMAMEKISGMTKDITSTHINDILNLWKKEPSSMIMLPYGITARKTYHGIWLLNAESDKCDVENEVNWQRMYALPEEGTLECCWGAFSSKIFPYNGEKIEEKRYTKWFDYDIIKTSLIVRTRRSGDYLIVNQEGQRKKLNRYMIDEKIPSELRDQLPLLAVGSEILWVPGGRISAKYKINEHTKRVLQVEYKRGEKINEGKNQHFIE